MQPTVTAPPKSADDWNRQGLDCIRRGAFEEAADCFRQAGDLDPQFTSAHNNLGATLIELGRFEAAIAAFRDILRIQPAYAEAHHNLGVALRSAGKLGDSVVSFGKALALKPDYPDAHNNLGITLLDLDRPTDAEVSFRRALRQQPGFALAWNNLGNALRALGRTAEAVDCYTRAIQARPDYVEAQYNLGTALFALRRHADAIACFRRAIALKPGFALAHLNLGVALANLRQRDEAIASFTRALELDPDNALARAQRMHLLARNCDWDALAADLALVPELGIVGGAVPPFALLAFEDGPHRHLIRAQRFTAEKHKSQPAPFATPSARPDKVKIGYFSADYSDHAVMHLAVALFENHDRDRFSIHAFSYGPPNATPMRRRLEEAFDSFTDVAALGDGAIAERARALGLDIAVDLQGYTEGSRLGIFAHRAAPLQLSFLGYPGTTGAPFIDYLLVDRTIVPPDMRDAYSERLIFLPDSYQPNDRRPVASSAWTRDRAGLPEAGFVFCCFNNSYKITWREFGIWMELLKQVEGSVLWLLRTNAQVERNLRKEAERFGIDDARLVFAPMMATDEHLARHCLAGLFLDTFAYTAHTTASDALWAGLPVVTKLGQGFAARVSASLLKTAGLDELVTDSDEAYAALALDLATRPKRLANIRKRLATTIADSPLFDGPRFARGMEAACDAAFERLVQGLPPDDIAVPIASVGNRSGTSR